MNNLYNKNGLIFWDHNFIEWRNSFVQSIKNELELFLKNINRQFQFFQIDAPLLTPLNLLNSQYSSEDFYKIDDELCLRPETTMGSYEYAKFILSNHSGIKLPFVIWQHGKSFRREQDQVTKNMRLKEFYQLEFQILFSPTTRDDYKSKIIYLIHKIISKFLGECKIEESDRLPSYSVSTTDIINQKTSLELCSISERTDFELSKVIEVAIGTDRCAYCFLGEE